MFVFLFVCLCMATVAMGRCQSTPGLVETKGRISIEDMWLHSAPQPIIYNQQSLIRYLIWSKYSFVRMQKQVNHHTFFPLIRISHPSFYIVHFPNLSHNPVSQNNCLNPFEFYSHAPSPRSTRGDLNSERPSKFIDSPGSISPSVHSSDERPRSLAASHQFRPQSQPSRSGSKTSHIMSISIFYLCLIISNIKIHNCLVVCWFQFVSNDLLQKLNGFLFPFPSFLK